MTTERHVGTCRVSLVLCGVMPGVGVGDQVARKPDCTPEDAREDILVSVRNPGIPSVGGTENLVHG